MHALVAFDKFKGALSATDACAIAVSALPPSCAADACPLTDGGEGFCSILLQASGGEPQYHRVTGPRGTPVDAPLGLVSLEKVPAAARALLDLPTQTGRIAVIEMAAASGLALLPSDQHDPWRATSFGTGELIRHAATAGVDAVLLGVGGSATNDLGLGALAALGWTFTDGAGNAVTPPVPAEWARIASIGGRPTIPLPPIRIACDVTNPLLGARGATATYGPQKGLLAPDFTRLETQCENLSARLCQHFGRPLALRDAPGAGAAGGIAFGLQCATGAAMLPGFEFVAAWFDLPARLAASNVVLTGEGRFDDSSLQGKGPGAIVRHALALGKPVHVFAGQVDLATPPAGLHLHAITPAGTSLPKALEETAANLATTVRRTFSAQVEPRPSRRGPK